MQLPPGQHGLEQVARVHGPLGLARPHDGVQLVDEQEYAPLRLLHLVEHRLQPLLKLPPVLGPGDEGTHVQGKDGLVLQPRGHVALHNPLGQPLGDGGLAHPRLPDEHRVVLALAAQNADHVADLVVPADDRVQLVLLCPLHQVGAILFQRLVGLLRVVAGHPLVPPQGGQGLHHLLPVHAVGAEQLLHTPLRRVQQGQEQVLHGDKLVLHAPRDGQGLVHGLVHTGGDVDPVRLPPRPGHLGQQLHLMPRRRPEGLHRQPHPGQKLGDEAPLLVHQGQQQVGLLDLLAAVLGGDVPGVLDGLQGFLGKLVHIHQIHAPLGGWGVHRLSVISCFSIPRPPRIS